MIKAGITILFVSATISLFTSCSNESKESTTETAKDSATTTSTNKYIKGEAGNIYVDDGGSGGVPVLFVHSFGGDTRQWTAQLEHLRKNRRAIAIDLRGNGQSDSAAGNKYDIPSFANDIAAVADSLGLDRFVLVGHSMGGSAGIAYAALHPDKLAGLVLTGTPGYSDPKQSAQVIASLQSEMYDTVMTQYMVRLLKNAKPEVAVAVNTGVKKLSKPASITMIKATFDYDPRPALQQYKGPVLFIYTPADNAPNALPKQYPAIPLVTIDSTSHWIQMDKPAEFNEALDEFLKKIDVSK